MPINNFHDIRFPTAIAINAVVRIHRATAIIPLANGTEQRITAHKNARRIWDVGLGVRTLNDLYEMIEFFQARMGQLYAFRFKDPTDFKSCPPMNTPSATDQFLGLGDGVKTQFRLQKAYTSGTQKTLRNVSLPVTGTVLVAINGSPTTAYTIDNTGLITFTTPPANDATITAGFEFDVLVRFAEPDLDINLVAFKAGAMPSIPLIEIMG